MGVPLRCASLSTPASLYLYLRQTWSDVTRHQQNHRPSVVFEICEPIRTDPYVVSNRHTQPQRAIRSPVPGTPPASVDGERSRK